MIFCSCCFVFYYQSYSMLILPHFNTSNTLYPEISGQMSIYLKKTKLYLNLSHSVFVSVSLPVYLSVCLSLFLNIFFLFAAFGCHSGWTSFNTSCYHVSGEPTSWVDSMVSIRFVASFCDEGRKGETYRKYLDKHKTK